MLDLRRRQFLTLLGGAAVWPLAARAQQSAMPVVGFLGPPLITREHWLTAFRRGLTTEGFVEGQNVTVEYRLAHSGAAELPELAAELIRRQIAVIFALGPPAALAAKRSTQTIPIVFVSGGDPVQMGLVSSFNRPAGNVTGFYLVAKRLALLRELLPQAERVAVLVNPTNAATAEPTARGAAVAGRALSLDIQRALPRHPDPELSWHSGFRGGAHGRSQTTPVLQAARRRGCGVAVRSARAAAAVASGNRISQQ